MDTSCDTVTSSVFSSQEIGKKKTLFRMPKIECEGMLSLSEAVLSWTQIMESKSQQLQVQIQKDVKTQNAALEKLKLVIDRQDKKIQDQAEAILYLEDKLKRLKKRKNISSGVQSDSDSGSSDDSAVPECLKKIQRARKFLNRVQFFASDYEGSEDEAKNQSVSRSSDRVAKTPHGISNGTDARKAGAASVSNGSGSSKRVTRSVGKKTSDSETGFSDLNINIDLNTEDQASLKKGKRSLSKKKPEALRNNFKTPARVSSLSSKRCVGKQLKMNTSSPVSSVTQKSAISEGEKESRCLVCKKEMFSKAELEQHLLWTFCGQAPKQ